MSHDRLEQILKSLDRVGTLVRDRSERQVWRFEFRNKPYYLYFHPRLSLLRRSTNPALHEFYRLQDLQRAGIASPRAVAAMQGFRLGNRLGDAVLVEGIEPSQTLLNHLLDRQFQAASVPDRRDIVRQVAEIVRALGRNKLGHCDLRLDKFLISQGRIYLLDARGLYKGGMRSRDVFTLAHDASRFASQADLRRAWSIIEPDEPVPANNPQSARLYAQVVRRCTKDNEDFGVVRHADWFGWFPHTTRYARRGSPASRIVPHSSDWSDALPRLLDQMESAQLDVLKSDASSDVLAGEIVLGGHPIQVVIKRLKGRSIFHRLRQIGRPSRAKRQWRKTWSLIARNLPTEWPLLLIEKRKLGLVVDALLVFERVPGRTLDQVDLDAMSPEDRRTMFFRTGRILRIIERTGLTHTDAKSTNWIIQPDEQAGPTPVLIDAYGIRPLTFFTTLMGLHRLLRAMRQHPQYTPTDSLDLCRGFTPWSRISREQST